VNRKDKFIFQFTRSLSNQLKEISVQEYQHCFKKWEQRLRQGVASDGDYFEKDRVNIDK